MPTTAEALVIALIAVLPGAMYLWGFEREDGPWSVGLADRTLRFVGASGLLSPFSLPLVWLGYRELVLREGLRDLSGPAWWVWTLPPGLFVVPAVLGLVVGYAARRGKGWVRPLVGAAPAPRGWDQLFRTPELEGYVRLRLLDGTWLIGVWAGHSPGNTLPGSYAAGFPHPQDLYFVDTCVADAEGTAGVDDGGRPVLTGVATLVRWDQVAYADFLQAPVEETR